jgi:hypothetical protein
MVAILSSLFGGRRAARQEDESGAGGASTSVAERIAALDADPYLAVADSDRHLISVFDDLRYDRADPDMISPPMRRRAIERLAPLGFRQVSGSVLENRAEDVRVVFPRFRALGASPFHAARDAGRREQDYLVLTPTQAACALVDAYPVEEAVERIKALIAKHPINSKRGLTTLGHAA